jgi:predicted membrane protein
MYYVHSKDGVNEMNASVTMRQAGESKKVAELRLSFEERKIFNTFLIQFIPFLNVFTFLGTLIYIHIYIYIYKHALIKIEQKEYKQVIE